MPDIDSSTDSDSDSKPDGYIVLHRIIHIAQRQTQIPTSYFCTGQESGSESVPVSESGNVNEPLELPMVHSHCPTPKQTPRPIKMGCIELCIGVHTAQRQTSTQSPIGHCSDCTSLGLGVGVGVGQCEHTIRSLGGHLQHRSQRNDEFTYVEYTWLH